MQYQNWNEGFVPWKGLDRPCCLKVRYVYICGGEWRTAIWRYGVWGMRVWENGGFSQASVERGCLRTRLVLVMEEELALTRPSGLFDMPFREP